ncbi:MAG: PIN domain-containing protein [Rhodoferax sp.]|nr:PIN domain-containing protein [Rhodoferax sp.]
MAARDFIDTNVFIYQLDASDTRKHGIADHLVRESLRTGDGCISAQVAQECLNVITSKARVPLGTEQAQAYLDAVLVPLIQVGTSPELLRRALDLRARWQFGFYDALVVAGALTAGCTRLLTEDLQHGQRVEQLTIVNPFLDTAN